MSAAITICETEWCPPALRRGAEWNMEGIDDVTVLGESLLSTVAECCCRRSGLRFALKMYHKDRMTAANHRQVAREVRLHARLQHRNVLALYAAFEDNEGINLVLEFAAGSSLYYVLGQAGGYLPEERVATRIMPALVSAVAHMHAQNILHRDIKPENILVMEDGDVRLADLGLALDLAVDQPRACVGTLDYMPPEMAEACLEHPAHEVPNGRLKLACYGLPVDVWATGVLAYELLVGGSPFEADTKEETYEKIMQGTVWMPRHLSRSAQHFIQQALQRRPEDRPSAAQQLSHAWLNSHVLKD